MTATCPNDPAHKRFVTVAHVTEDWMVDEHGEPIPDHGKTLHLSFYQEMFDENNAAQG